MYDVIIGRSESDKQKFGMKGVIFLGKHYVQMGRTTSLSNSIYMDVTRSHVLFICGKRGSGKCLTGDTLISMEDGSLIPIGELADSEKSIICLNNNLKLNIGKKEGFYKRKVNKIYKIKLRTGKTIELTPEHPLLTVNGWVPANNLNFNERIATPRTLPFFGDDDMAESKVKLLSYLIAEGHLGDNFVLFSNMDDKIVEDFKLAVKQFDSNLIINTHSKKGCFRVVQNLGRKIISQGKRDNLGRFIGGPKINNYKSSLRNWIDSFGLYGKDSYTKFIPPKIFTLPKNKIALFLNRLFSCDGCIYHNSPRHIWCVSYTSSSEQIIRQVQHLLLKFGIVSIIRDKLIKYKGDNKKSFELTIIQKSLHTFLQEIGFYGKKELKAEIAIKECIKITNNTNVDTIPKEIWKNYQPNNWKEIGEKMGYKRANALKTSINYSPSRQKLFQIAKYDQNEQIMALANSDIFWDEIVKIEEIQKETDVYDITVPDTHNFVANDIIVHNSYTMGVIAEGVADLPVEVKQNISIIMLDTMGVYWTMKYPNKKDDLLLKQWGLKAKPLDVKIYTPAGFHKKFLKQGIPTDAPFSIKPNELDATDWCLTFGVDRNDSIGVLIESIINKLKKEKPDYSIDDIIKTIKEFENADQAVKSAVENRFLNTESWGLFDEKGTPFKELATGGQVTILDVSCYATTSNGWEIKSLVVGLIAQKLFIQRMIARKDEEYQQVQASTELFGKGSDTKQEMPLVWLVIDEAHEFLPREGKTASSDALITILREGRQPGISLILATQQPGKIHTDVMTQSDTVLSHRITAKMDVEALGLLMQSYMREGLTGELDKLPSAHGAAIIFDDTNEKMYPMRIRPRFTWHGGESPIAIHNTGSELK
ncbi:MAG: LAGLIDADG family homing endonuclease [Candidatus Woesearchaeota archaeon]